MREDAPVEVPARRLPSHVVPVASYWIASGLVIYGIASHALPVGRWVESLEAQAPEEPALVAVAEPPAPEPPAPEPEALPPPPTPASEPLPEPLPFEPAPEPPPAVAAAPLPAPPAAPAPRPEPPRAAAPAPSLAALTPPKPSRRDPLSVSGPGTSSALVWRTARDPFEETLPPLTPPTASRDRSAADDSSDAEEPAPREPEPKQPQRPIPAIASGSSCEAAIAAYNEEMNMKGGPRTPDLPREAFAAVLDRGTYLTGCGVPDTMRIDICAAVQRGRAVGVTVVTKPANGAIQACVARAVRGLRFPSNPRLDVARTRFE